MESVDRFQVVLKVAKGIMFSKNVAQAFVGGRSRLERLVAENKIRAEKTTDKQNGRWECNADDVLKYAIAPTTKEGGRI